MALVLQGLWFRRWVSLAVLVVASLVVGAAATGPVFARAAEESVLQDTLAQAVTAGRGVSDRVRKTPLSSRPLQLLEAKDAAKLAERPTLRRLLGAPVASVELSEAAGSPGKTPEDVLLVWRDGVCGHLRIVRGQCADRPGTVVVSEGSAAIEHWQVGHPLVVHGQTVDLAGTYMPVDPTGDYFAGRPYFAAYPTEGGDSRLDAVFASWETVNALDSSSRVLTRIDRQLELQRLRVADLPALERELSTWSVTDESAVVGDTAVPVVLQEAVAVVEKVALPVAVVDGQLILLCWLVLFLVVANAAEARGPEVALAKLRGLPVGATVAFGLFDTLVLVLLAVPVGLLLAREWTLGLTRWQMAPGIPVVLTSGAGWAAAGAGLGAVAAAVLATTQTLRRPVVEQWRRATRRVRSRPWLVDAAVACAAVVGLVPLLERTPSGTFGSSGYPLLTPGLVILSAALVGSRVLPGLCRIAYAPTRQRGPVAGMLAVRQLGRRPGTLRLALLLTIAFGLVVFGTDAWSTSRANAHDRAWTEVGAAEVLTVAVPPGTDLGDVVDRIDPSGAELAAVSTATDFTRLPPVLLLGVQPERFARVAFWRADFGPAPLVDLAHRLVAPTTVAPVLLSGTRIRVELDVTTRSEHRPVLVADVVQPSAIGGVTPVVLGPLGVGRQTVEAELPCTGKVCRLAGVELQRSDSRLVSYRSTVVLKRLEVFGSAGWRELPDALSTPEGWRPSSTGAGTATSGVAGTVLRVAAGSVDTPSWRVTDQPPALPALVSAGVDEQGRTSSAGFGSRPLVLDPVAVTSSLPAGGIYGVVVDRTTALRASQGSVPRDVETVWVSPAGVVRASAELEAAHVTVLGTSSADSLARIYGRQGTALALLLYVAGASLAALLASAGAALTLHLNGRRRTYELAALLAVGLRRRTLVSSLCLEQGLLVLFGVVVGTAAGLVSAELTLPVIPTFSDSPTAPPLRYDLHLGPVAAALAVAVVVLAVAVTISSISLVRRAHPDQLREAPA